METGDHAHVSNSPLLKLTLFLKFGDDQQNV
jgi:hypothetical protein